MYTTWHTQYGVHTMLNMMV